MKQPNCAGCVRMAALELVIIGNGTPGLSKQVENHERYIQQQKGEKRVLTWIVSLLGIGNILATLIINYLRN